MVIGAKSTESESIMQIMDVYENGLVIERDNIKLVVIEVNNEFKYKIIKHYPSYNVILKEGIVNRKIDAVKEFNKLV